MKKEYRYIIIVFFGVLGLLWLEKPLRELLNEYFFNKPKNELIAGILVRSFILVIVLKITSKFNLQKFNGIGKEKTFNGLLSLIFPVSIVLMGFMRNWQTYLNADVLLLLLFTCSVFLVGFVEEITFRGIILPLFIKSFYPKKTVVYVSAILSSLIFGLIHYVNLFRQPDNFWGITSQVFFALSIGVFFSGLLLRTGNIIITSVFHGFVNFSFGAGKLKSVINEKIIEESSNIIDWSSLIPTTTFFCIILISGLYMVKKVSKISILKKLELTDIKMNASLVHR